MESKWLLNCFKRKITEAAMGWFHNSMKPVRESDLRLIQDSLHQSNQFRTSIDNLASFLDTQKTRAERLAHVLDTSSELGQELHKAIVLLAQYESYTQPRIPMALEERTTKIQDLLAQFELPRLKRNSIFLRRVDMPNYAEDINNQTIGEWMTYGEPYRTDLSDSIKTIDKAEKQVNPLAGSAIDEFDTVFHI